MSPERWQRVRAVFDRAVECAPSEAERVLRETCGDDASLCDEVRRMLAEHERSSPLDQAIWERSAMGVFAAGQTVAGRYRIVRYLSRGGMGEVYEAQDLELGERVALKALLPDIGGDDRMIARFKQEIQLARKIGHPHVCRVFDLARHPADGSAADTVFFLTMEFLPGETLAARLEREGRMSSAEALPLLEQIAQALDAAHRSGVIHRDFKPSNVMLVPPQGSRPMRAVVTDFGLARSHAPEAEPTISMSGLVMGTVDYMAPELLTGAQASFASDIYALGMVAYKTITGALPFASDTPLAAAILRSRQAIPSPKAFVPGLDARCERAIVRALDANPARRFSSAAEFIAAFRGESTGITLALPVMTRRKWVAAAAAVVLVIAGWLGWRNWMQYRSLPSPEASAMYRKGADDIAAGAYFAATKALDEAVKLAPHYALAHARLAEAWVELETPEKAQEQMLLARREDISGLSQMDRLQIEAIDLRITREFAAAVAKYEQMSKLAGGNSAELAVDLGRAFELAGKPERAVESYRHAAEGPEHNPAAWLRLGVLYAHQSSAAKSDAAFSEAERLYQLTSNLEGLTELAYQRGVAANRRQRVQEGAAFLHQALDTAGLAGDVEQEIRIKLQLATNAYVAGDAEAAERYTREALSDAQSNRLELQAIVGLLNLGNAYLRRPDFQGAEEYYNRALALARSLHSDRFIALSQLYLASLHDQEDRPEEVVRDVQAALPFFQSNRFTVETLSCLTLLGRAQLDRGNPQEALTSGRRLLALAEASQDPSQLYLAHTLIGAAFSDLESYPEALDQYRKSLKPDPGSEMIAYADVETGKTLCHLGRCAEARPLFDDAAMRGSKFPPLLVRLAAARASMALSEGQYPEAVRITRNVLSAAAAQNQGIQADLDQTLGLALIALGQKPEGLRICEQSVGLALPSGLFAARMALLEARLATGDTVGAKKTLGAIEAELDRHPETRWRALATVARADPSYAVRARKALDQLKQLWGREAFDTYIKRPDFRKLWPVLGAPYANQ